MGARRREEEEGSGDEGGDMIYILLRCEPKKSLTKLNKKSIPEKEMYRGLIMTIPCRNSSGHRKEKIQQKEVKSYLMHR